MPDILVITCTRCLRLQGCCLRKESTMRSVTRRLPTGLCRLSPYWRCFLTVLVQFTFLLLSHPAGSGRKSFEGFTVANLLNDLMLWGRKITRSKITSLLKRGVLPAELKRGAAEYFAVCGPHPWLAESFLKSLLAEVLCIWDCILALLRSPRSETDYFTSRKAKEQNSNK